MTLYKILVEDLISDTVLGVLYFPLWWYSQGLKKTAQFCWKRIASGWRFSGLWSFFKNFFRPMYGARGWDAYVLSVFTRIWQMAWRFFVLTAWSLFWLLLLVLWLVLPLFLIWQLII